MESGYSTKYRADIDGLRAIAILLVVVFHAFPTTFKGGFVGVDIFFVISGYLITSIIYNGLNNHNFSFKRFYIRRINRIYPVLMIVLLSFFILGWFALLPNELEAYGYYMARAGVFYSNFALWKSAGYFDTASDLKPLLHLWSLGIEEQFYLIWPLLLWGAYKKKINLLKISLLLFFISYGLNIKNLAAYPIATFYLPFTRFFELLVGSLIALFPSYYPQNFLSGFFTNKKGSAHVYNYSNILSNIIAFLGLLCIAIAVYQLNPNKPFPGNNALLPLLGASFLIAVSPTTWINRYLLSNRIMVGIGLISFSLYLWHWPLLSFARMVEQKLPSIGIRIACLGLSFLLAILTYLYIEKPIRLGRKQQALKAAILVSLSICVVGLGFYTTKQKGFTHRAILANVQFPKFAGQVPPNVEKRAVPVDFGISSHHGKRSVFILGDSHAHHLLSGFFKIYPKNHISVILIAGCPFLFGIERQITSLSCLALTERALSDKELDQVKTVVFSFRMFAYNRSGLDYNPEKQDWGLWYKSKRLKLDDLSFWQPALRETFQLLLKKNKRIILTYDVPELFYNINRCLKRPLRLTKAKTSDSRECDMPREVVDKRQEAVRKLVAEVLKEFPQVEVFDPLKYFCDQKWCYAFKDGKPLYYDDDHLSAKGSELYASSFAKEFPSLIRKASSVAAATQSNKLQSST